MFIQRTVIKNVFTLAAMALLFSSVGMAQSSDTTVSTKKENDWKREVYKPHVGIMAGVTNAESYDAAPEYGVDVGYQPYVPFGAGAEISSATSNNDNGADLTRTKLLAKGTYNFGGNIPVIRESFLGLGVGPMLESYGSSTEVAVGFMPYAGFDIPLQAQAHDYMSLGLNARYLATTSGGPDAFSVNGALKYWF